MAVTGSGHAAGDVGNLCAWVWTDGAWWTVPGATGPDGEVRDLASDAEHDRLFGVGAGAVGSHAAPFVWVASR